MGRLAPAWPGTAFWLEHFVSVYQFAAWSMLGGLGLFFLGVAVIFAEEFHRRRVA